MTRQPNDPITRRRHPMPIRAWEALLALACVSLFALDTAAMEWRTATRSNAGVDPTLMVPVYHQLEVAIHDQVAATTRSLQVRNDSTEVVELTCTLHLVEGEIVDGYAYWNGAEKIVGEVLPKEAARRMYDQITGVRRDPGILEKEGSRFRFQVFPVQPAETKSIEVRTVGLLQLDGGVVEYRIPQADLPTAGTVLSMHVDISDELPITSVETVGFPGRAQRLGPRRWQVVFESDKATFDGDAVVRYHLASPDYALRFLAHRSGGDDGSFLLLVSPKDRLEQVDVLGRDIVFVVDVSGSMSGEPLQQTKAALRAILGKLDQKDRFDIVAFADEPISLFGHLQPADSDHCAQAAGHVDALQIRGGTNIQAALSHALGELKEVDPGRPRAVLFLTDGQGSAPPEVVLADVRTRVNGARIFSFGAGPSVNTPFLTRLATDNRGTVCLIQRASEIGRQVTQVYERIAAPLMADLSLEVEGGNVSQVYPKELPDLYRGGQVVVLGRYSQSGPATIRLSSTVRGARQTFTLPVTLPELEDRHASVEKLWASRRIDHLTELIATRREDELVDEVTRLGMVYNIATEYTAFVAIPESEQTAEIRQQLEEARGGVTRKLIEAMNDVRLSMTNIPPGDPVLTVEAPGTARKVVAYFPFGFVKELRYDRIRERWSCRFLVPRGVKDGTYSIRIQIVSPDGSSEWREISIVVDATAPEFDAQVPTQLVAGETFAIEVDPFEPIRSVTAVVVGEKTAPVELSLDTDTGHYIGTLHAPAEVTTDSLVVRVVVRDLARNRCQRDIPVHLARLLVARPVAR